ncbi:uncharacterized protein Gasu_49260 [Galdieria sulphuraria]|uniref:Uncharacterized protein n=1 Tax=Galdieria sulphuraria TaxID=130081 RepID=M2WU86_GALSU|nr:uncharacterized protein Gasu_49260 [Galdieria sulphuraria]EME27475.1 hypothetical protein Gasu_49260 [Galdieria sulphuraria]|eukprot:XP_005703995.1 hypothetical protein Gasu_49260 [Galdieria sulphuraria]
MVNFSPGSTQRKPILNHQRSVDPVDTRSMKSYKSTLEKLKKLREETRQLFSDLEQMEEVSLSHWNVSVNMLSSKQSYTLRKLDVLDRRYRYAMIALTG